MRPVFPFVLLDLDGTLTDSAPGILNAIEYALRHFHIDVPRSELNFMIGPPITEGFTRLLGGDRADDIEGGHSAGMRAAGVLYGYGSREELSGAEYLCESPADIVRCAASVEGAGK